MSPDDPPPSVAVDNLTDDPFTAEEQAAFDAMREGGEVEPLSGGDPPPEPEARQQEQVVPPVRADKVEPAQPDTDPDIEVTDPKTGTKQKRVSIHKYQRLEERAKAAEDAREVAAKERQELLDRYARADERLKIINEAMASPEQPQQQQEEDDPPPDPEKDIFGYAIWQGKQINKLTERLNGIETGAREATSETEVANTYKTDAARFAQTQPAFAEAYVYLIQQRDAELQLAGVTDQAARERQIVNEEKGLVKAAIQQKRSPAELIFSMAKGRGYVPKAAGDPPPPPKDPKALDAQVTTKTNGSVPAVVPAAKAPNITEEIEAIKRGQEAAASLSNVGGGAPVRELTSQVLADMPEEEFDDLVARLPREKLMELMGN